MKHLNKIILVALAATMFSCDDDFKHPIEDIQVSAGEANFQKYIALGNSLTSGYRDNALYKSGQENSYPNMLAGLMKAAGGGEFNIPYMPNDTGGFIGLPGFPGKLVLTQGSMSPIQTDAGAQLDNIAAAGPYQNMGVPGAKSYHLLAEGYGNSAGLATGKANPYFVRFASSPSTSVIADAVKQSPTFFSLWIGNNDVLGYATSGGLGVDHNETGNMDASTYGSSDISNATVVAGALDKILGAMTTSNPKEKTKGVIANIPSVTSIPYFTTVPYAPLSPANPSFAPMIDELNATYAGLNQVFDAVGASERKIVFSKTEASPVVIKDKDLSDLSATITAVLTPKIGAAKATLFGMIYGQARQATAKDLLVLTSSAVIGKVDEKRVDELKKLGLSQEEAGKLSVVGVSYPMTDNYVLTAKETAKAEAAVAKYNAAITSLATKYDLALVDAYSEMKKLSSNSGIKYYGQTYTTAFISGGAFSLDGVHLTGNGYAIVANMFVDAINRKYHSTLRKVYPGNYPGITIP